MLEVFKFEKGGYYPHMKPRDIAIWERFIAKYPDAYNQCQYDVNVGDPPPFNTLTDEGEDWNQDALYRLKIDVVAGSPLGIDVIEIKPDASPATIGQIKGYRALYIRDEEPKGDVGMVIVTDKIRPNMEWLCRNEGIKLIEV